MPEKPYISQGAYTGDDLYAQGAFPLGIGTFNPAEIINPGDTGLFAGFEPVMVAISTPNPGGVLLEAKTAFGAAPLLISDAAKNQIWSLLTNIKPVQDLHGYANPWPAGGGVNVFDVLTWITLGANSSNYSVSSDETITVLQNDAGGISNRLFSLTAGDTYSALVTGNIATIRVYDSTSQTLSTGSAITFTVPADGKIAVKFTAASYPSSGKCIIVKGSTVPSTWSPYANICPITGWSGCNVYVSPTTNAADATVYSCVWQDEAGTVYGGTVDVASGFGSVEWEAITLDGSETWSGSNAHGMYTQVDAFQRSSNYTNLIKCESLRTCVHNSNPDFVNRKYGITGWGGAGYAGQNWIYIAAAGINNTTDLKTWLAQNPVKVVFVKDAATPFTFKGVNIFTLEGVNYIWTDCGDQITVQYAAVK